MRENEGKFRLRASKFVASSDKVESSHIKFQLFIVRTLKLDCLHNSFTPISCSAAFPTNIIGNSLNFVQ